MRHFDDWVESFITYTEGLQSPELFRRWAAITTIACALQRKTFANVSTQVLWPNMFVLLIAGPGIGKSNAIKTARHLLKQVARVALTPARITPRAFYHELEASQAEKETIEEIEELYTHASLAGMIDEFSVFVRPNATEFMCDLADLYDCTALFEYKTSTQGENKAYNCLINLIGGATPAYLKEAWTATVLGQGFPARCIVVYSDDKIQVEMALDTTRELTPDSEIVDESMEENLVLDLRTIADLKGKFIWTVQAAKELVGWENLGMPPIPEDERLKDYITRRKVHVIKIAMATCAARDDGMGITLSDLETSRDLLLETERLMLQAIEPLGASPYRDAMILVRKFVTGMHKRGHSTVPENRLRQILINEVDPVRINHILNEMVLANWLDCTGEAPGRRFFPGSVE